MADEEDDYKVGPSHPPLHTRFRKGQSGNPGGRSQKKLHALLADALNEPVFVTVDGEPRKITKGEAVVHQLVNKSPTADLRATKMLFDMIKEVEQKASVTRRCPNLAGSMRRTRRWCSTRSVRSGAMAQSRRSRSFPSLPRNGEDRSRGWICGV